MQISESAVREALTALKEPGELFEIRILAGKNYSMSGYFTDAETAVEAMKTTPVWKGSQIYYTINRILPECFSREQHNCFLENVTTTNDNDISYITTLLIDADPKRRTGISSTEQEKRHARDVAQSVVTLTRSLNWPEPIQAMSGNGYHCLYELEPLPNAQENIELIKKVLQAFDQQCSTDECEIDTSVFNPARISKLYGTLAQKGCSTDERPHRMSRLINVPDARDKVTRQQLESFAQIWKNPDDANKSEKRTQNKKADSESAGDDQQPAAADAPRKSCRKYGIKDLGEYLDSLGIGHAAPEPYKTGRKFVLDKCVFDESHEAPDAAVFQYPDGLLAYRCLHNSCKNYHFAQFIQKVDPGRYISAQKPERAPITIEDLEDEYEERGISLKLNLITHEIEVISDDPDMDLPSLITTTHSSIRGNKPNFTGVTFDTLSAYSEEIAKKSKFNPVLEYISGIEYDGKDHIKDLCELMGLDKEDQLSRALVRKWFIQGVVLLHNTESEPIPAEGVLTLQGPQRCGKTSLIEKFSIKPEWFARGASLNSKDKDTLRRCCTRWIIELGEVETTLRSDIEALKNFITSSYDQYRLPFGHFDLNYARRANLAATCNSDKYLIDQTGNRRWWTVPITKFISYSDIQAFPIAQLWAQALRIYRDEGADSFRLTAEEHEALNERNNKALKPMKAEDEVNDVIEAAKQYPHEYKWVNITVTAWKQYHAGLKNFDSSTIGKALKKIGITQKQDGCDRLYRLPVWKEASSIYSRKPAETSDLDAG